MPGDFADGAGTIEVLEPCIAIGVHPAAEVGEVILRVLAFAVTGEAIPGCRWRGAAPRPFVAGIGPEPCRLGLSGAGRQHADGRVVGEDRLGRQDMAADGIGQGFQQGRALADPVGQCRAIQIEAFAAEDLALAIQRKMISVFADQHMGQQARTWAAALDGARRKRRLDEAFAAGAGQPVPDDPVHDEAAGHVFQFFRPSSGKPLRKPLIPRINCFCSNPDRLLILLHLADPAQTATAIGTGIGAGGQFNLHPGDMIRDRTTLRFVLLLDVGQLHPGGHRGGGDLVRHWA